MPAASVMRITFTREASDCAIAALSSYLGESYEDVLRVVTLTDRQQGRNGLWTRTLQRVAKRLGHVLKVRRGFDLEEAYGILRLPHHAVVLRNGLIFDGDGTVWPADAYLAHVKFQLTDCDLLVSED